MSWLLEGRPETVRRFGNHRSARIRTRYKFHHLARNSTRKEVQILWIPQVQGEEEVRRSVAGPGDVEHMCIPSWACGRPPGVGIQDRCPPVGRACGPSICTRGALECCTASVWVNQGFVEAGLPGPPIAQAQKGDGQIASRNPPGWPIPRGKWLFHIQLIKLIRTDLLKLNPIYKHVINWPILIIYTHKWNKLWDTSFTNNNIEAWAEMFNYVRLGEVLCSSLFIGGPCIQGEVSVAWPFIAG